jgi:hypothetical protein
VQLTSSSQVRRVKSWGFNQSEVGGEVTLVRFPEGAIFRFLVDVTYGMVSVADSRKVTVPTSSFASQQRGT